MVRRISISSNERRGNKLIPELRCLNYEKCLKECGLTAQVASRLRGDQIEYI